MNTDEPATQPETETASTAGTQDEPKKARAWLSAAGAWARSFAKATAASWPDIAIVGGLLAVFFQVHRRVEPVEFGGDAVIKWQFVRQWWYHFDWKHAELYHHHGRMGVNAVAGVAQALFGRGWRTYYVAPFFVAALQMPFVYAIGKRVANRLAGILAALFIIYLATVHRNASQMLPDPFVGTYATIAAYFCVRFSQAEAPQKKPFLVAMALAAFVGYQAKETFVFFFPGMTLALWFHRRAWRDVATFLGILLAGLVIETALYATFTRYSSRYAVVRSVHGADGIWQQMDFVQLFDRFTKLHDGWKYFFFFALASGIWLLVLNTQQPALGRAVALIGFSHVFFLMFLVRRFNPIELWQSLEPRYMEPFTPFAAIFSGALLGQALFGLWQERRWPDWVLRYGPTSAAFGVFWCLGFVVVVQRVQQALGAERFPDGWAMGERLSRVMNDTYSRNLPIAQVRRGRPKVLTVMYDVYVDDKALVRDGKLPDLMDVARNEAGLTYLVKSPSAYRRGKVAALADAGCVIEVTRKGHGYQLSSWEPLPASCDELLRR